MCADQTWWIILLDASMSFNEGKECGSPRNEGNKELGNPKNEGNKTAKNKINDVSGEMKDIINKCLHINREDMKDNSKKSSRGKVVQYKMKGKDEWKTGKLMSAQY